MSYNLRTACDGFLGAAESYQQLPELPKLLMSRFPLRFRDSIEITKRTLLEFTLSTIAYLSRRQILMYKCLHSTNNKILRLLCSYEKLGAVSTELPPPAFRIQYLTPKTLYAFLCLLCRTSKNFMLLCTRTIPLKNLRSEDNNHSVASTVLSIAFAFGICILHFSLYHGIYTRGHNTNFFFLESGLVYCIMLCSLFMG